MQISRESLKHIRAGKPKQALIMLVPTVQFMENMYPDPEMQAEIQRTIVQAELAVTRQDVEVEAARIEKENQVEQLLQQQAQVAERRVAQQAAAAKRRAAAETAAAEAKIEEQRIQEEQRARMARAAKAVASGECTVADIRQVGKTAFKNGEYVEAERFYTLALLTLSDQRLPEESPEEAAEDGRTCLMLSALYIHAGD